MSRRQNRPTNTAAMQNTPMMVSYPNHIYLMTFAFLQSIFAHSLTMFYMIKADGVHGS
jgi:hypothetical protein